MRMKIENQGALLFHGAGAIMAAREWTIQRIVVTTPGIENLDKGLPFGRLAIPRWAFLGGMSGIVSTLSIHVFGWAGLLRARAVDPGPLGIFDPLVEIFGLSISPLSLGPGLVFGLFAGFALRRYGLADGWRYPALAAASMLSYFAAVQLTFQFLFTMDYDIILTGMVAGLLGAGLLTGATALLIPTFRRLRPCATMVAAGAGLGALLVLVFAPLGFFGWLALFVPWQAGYAAAMATAFHSR